ncbi:hypothetical protein DSECCO2_383000 [anaerobic digester metagenome]
MTGGRSYPGGNCSGFSNALFQDLALCILAIPEERILVHRLVQLSVRCIDTDLPEQALHTEGPGLIGDDGHDPLPYVLVLYQLGKQANEGHGGGKLPFSTRGKHILKTRGSGNRQFLSILIAERNRTAHRLTAPGQKLTFLAFRVGLDEDHVLCLLVINGYVEVVPEGKQVFLFHVLQVVRPHRTFTAAHAVALDGLEQYDRGRTFLVRCCMECLIDFSGVMTSTTQLPQVLVGLAFHQ